MAGLMYQGSELPDSVKKAAQGYLDYQKAIKAKIPLAYEGSAVPDSVRKAAQAALEKGPSLGPAGTPIAAPAAPAAAPAGWMDGTRFNIGSGEAKGLLQGAGNALKATGRALGPAAMAYEGATAINDQFGKGAWDKAQIMAEEGQTRKAMQEDPGLAGRGAETVDRISQRATAGVQGLMAQVPEEAQAAQQVLQQSAPQAQPEAPAAPPPPPPAVQKKLQEVQAAQQQRQTEGVRQTLEKGTIEGLKTGQTSVSQLATGIVQADAQRSGKELTPAEQQKAVTAEIQTLKTMDKSDMAKYVSYALVAGGLLAAVFDKSGKAGDSFNQSFNRQLDRNLEQGKMNLAQAQAAQKAAIDSRKVDISEKDVDSKIEDRGVQQGFKQYALNQGDKKIEIAEESLGIDRFKANTTASQGAQRIGLMQRGQDLDQQGREASNALGYARIEAADKRAAAKAAGGTSGGQPMSHKESLAAVDTMGKAKGMALSDAVKADVASQIPALMKARPGLSVEQAVQFALDKANKGQRYKTAKNPWYKRGDETTSLVTE